MMRAQTAAGHGGQLTIPIREIVQFNPSEVQTMTCTIVAKGNGLTPHAQLLKGTTEVGDCNWATLKCHIPNSNVQLLPALHRLYCSGFISFEPASAERVPQSFYEAQTKEKKEQRLAFWQSDIFSLQTYQQQRVWLVAVRVRIHPAFFFQLPPPGIAADSSSAHRAAHAGGTHVVVLIQHLVRGADTTTNNSKDTDIDINTAAASGPSSSHPGPSTSHGQADTGAGALTELDMQEWVPADRSTVRGHVVHDEVFEIVRPRGWVSELPDPPGLKCNLYRYQRRALSWMCWREEHGLNPPETPSSPHDSEPAHLEPASTAGAGGADSHSQPVVHDASLMTRAEYQQQLKHAQPPAWWPSDGRPHLLWTRERLQSGHEVWLNREDRVASLSLIKGVLPPLRGGMLCDEMGLGKTVEIIALMLARPPTQPLGSHVPRAEASQAMQDEEEEVHGSKEKWARLRGGTLIITPPPILQQWAGEIKTHANLKVGVYEGMRVHGDAMQAAHQRSAKLAEQYHKKCTNHLAKLKKQAAGGASGAAGGSGGKKAKNKTAAGGPAPSNEAIQQAEAAVRTAYDEMVAAQLAAESMSVLQVAEDEAARLAACDVVLTTYNVLSGEVNYVDKAIVRSLRHDKKYKQPVSPLLQVYWHRLVLDEAQQVGTSLTAVARMSNRLTTAHRWCVTGTPMGAGGLQDVFGAIAALQYTPLDDPGAFSRLVVAPYLTGSNDGYRRLQLLLKPIMWRNSKAVAAGDIALPPRTLHHALLRHDPAERAFYQHVVSEARKANAAWKRFKAGDEDVEVEQEAHHGSKKQNKGDLLARKAAQQLLQLRLACVHPQLTEYWRQLSNELQLGQAQGGALSVQEMLARMRDQAQVQLQNQERDYCQAADILADKLLKQAERLDPASPPPGSGEAGPSSTKKRKKPSGGGSKATKAAKTSGNGGPSASTSAAAPGQDTPNGAVYIDFDAVNDDDDDRQPHESPESKAKALREEALQLLESSYRVGERGVDAAHDEELSEDYEAIATNLSSWRLWRLVQVRTCHLLAERYEAVGRFADAVSMRRQLEEKEGELRERVEATMNKITNNLASVNKRADELKTRGLPDAWKEAVEEGGFPADEVVPEHLHVHTWLPATEARWVEARAEEASQSAAAHQEDAERGNNTALLGTVVSSLLAQQESELHGVMKRVEGVLGEKLLAAAWSVIHAAWQAAVDTVNQHARQARDTTSSPHQASESQRAAVLWAAGEAVEKSVALYCLGRIRQGQVAAKRVFDLLQGWLLPGGDVVGVSGLQRTLKYLSTKLEKRKETFINQQGDAAVHLRHCKPAVLQQVLDMLKMQVELLRTWREIHVESLKLEVESHNKELIRSEVAAAAAGGHVRGVGMNTKLGRMSGKQLRQQCDELLKQCEDLRVRKVYLDNQMHDANDQQAKPKAGDASTSQQHKQSTAAEEGAAGQAGGATAAGGGGGGGGATQATVGARAAGAGADDGSDDDVMVTNGAGTSREAATPGTAAHDIIDHTHDTAGAGSSAEQAKAVHGSETAQHARGPYKKGTGISSVLHDWFPGTRAKRVTPEPAAREGVHASSGAAQPMNVDDDDDDEVVIVDQPQHDRAAGAGEAGAAAVHTAPKPAATAATAHGGGRSVVQVVDLTLDSDDDEQRANGRPVGASAAGPSRPAAVPASNPAQGVQQAMQGGAGAGTAVECAVCLEEVAEGQPLMVYACGHFFCKECSDYLLSSELRPRCPTCRRDVAKGQVFRVIASSRSAVAGRHNPEINPPEGPRVMTIKCVGSWMTKIEALIRRLLLLRAVAPDEKALVFSHFPLALELVSKALQVNELGHVSLGVKARGARDAVARFNSDPTVHVFLLSLHHGAAGLTLVRANHVFIIDISTDPAIEQQAVARVHRIGQPRPVTVTRLLCEGTVEMQILEALQHKQQLFMEAHHVEAEEEMDMMGIEPEQGAPGHAAGAGAAAGSSHGGAGPSHGPGAGAASEEDPESALLASAAPHKEVLAVEETEQLLDLL